MEITTINWIILGVITLFGALAQSAIGFGFALITLPIYLLVVDVEIAIQLAMILTMATAVIMIFVVYKDIPKQTVKYLLIGTFIGFPIGLAVYLIATSALIKSIVGVVILLALGLTYINERKGMGFNETTRSSLITGVISGAMVSSIAMAGPAIAVYASAARFNKSKTRATIFSVFVISYGFAIILHASMNGFTPISMKVSLYLLPVVIVGLAVGQWLAGRISERYFKNLLSGTLVLVAMYLIYSVL